LKTISKFRDRLIFPIFDDGGHTIAFGGRSLSEDAPPKYINSNESEVFKKKEVLYGYHLASKNVSSNRKPYIVVEGYMDVITMHKHGFDTTVASMGTAFSSENLAKLWKYYSEPIICFDGDEAGGKAMLKVANLALEHILPGKSLRFCKLPQNSDPDSYIRDNSKREMELLLSKSIYMIDFCWDHFLDLYYQIETKIPEYIARWKQNVLAKLDIINNTELKNMYMREIKDRMYKFLKKNNFPNTSVQDNNQYSVNKKNSSLIREAILLYTILENESIFPYVSEKLSSISFSTQSFSAICDSLLQNDGDQSTIDRRSVAFAAKFCNFSSATTENILAFWNSVFYQHVCKVKCDDDIKSAKADFLRENTNKGLWERLKALKLDSLKGE
jgi:DNA primase